MQATRLKCSACDRQVRVVITDAPVYEGQPETADSEVVCLDVGDRCLGPICPLGAAAPSAMVARIIRNALPTDGLYKVQAICPSCGANAEMALYGNGRAACTVCGTPAWWKADHAEAMD
jgi:ribosomal protein S27AE